jgi:hypothetical protein
MSIRQLWNRIVATRYTRLLEAEVGRLRAENRALLNSILGIAGIPPIIVAPEGAENVPPRAQIADTTDTPSALVGGSVSSRRKPRSGNAPARGVAVNAPSPVRHRSWQQVNRMLELDSVRKRGQDTGDRSQASSHT